MDYLDAIVVIVAIPFAIEMVRLYSFRIPKEARSLRAWVIERYPEVWADLSWLERKLFIPQVVLSRLRRTTIQDPEFDRRFSALRRLEIRALAVALLTLLIIIVPLMLRRLGIVTVAVG